MDVWEIEFTDQFEDWWNDLSESEQIAIAAKVEMLQRHGPMLDYPHTSDIQGSRYGNMRELRAQHKGDPLRVFYAFDPRRVAIMLLGGDKTGDDRFYETYIPIADKLYDEHLAELVREGLLNGKKMERASR